ncbi:MAG: MATE family efflux transporter [Gammaproteobacteria bacterium]|nr:MATE family efflux transporter [Gammaproteobacteria bacterium]
MGPPRSGRTFDRSIVEGPIHHAVWKMAWPTMLQNVIGGLQGIVDHAMVGNFVGYEGNAAIGVAWQIFLVVVVFNMALFTGMGVMVARFAGANEPEKVNRTVYQAFLTAAAFAFVFLAPVGYFLAPHLLEFVNATAEVRAEALPYLRIMFVFSFGMLIFFMLGGALRSAGDAKTPLRLGVALTVLNLVLNVIFIRGLGPIPGFGTTGAAIGTTLAGGILAVYALHRLFTHRWVIGFHPGAGLKPDFEIIRSIFRFGIPAGIQGVAMNIGGVIMLAFVGSLALSGQAQAAYSVGYTQVFSLITWTSIGLMGAAAAVAGQNLGADRPDRSIQGVHVAAYIGLAVAVVAGALFLLVPNVLLSIFGMDDPAVYELTVELLAYLAVSGLFVTVALSYTGGLQGTGDTKSPLYISIVSQLIVPIGICTVLQLTQGLEARDIWLAIVLGHVTRAVLSMLRFRQARWRDIKVEIGPAQA